MTILVNKNTEFLKITHREVCGPRFFQTKDPTFYLGLSPFPSHLSFWARGTSDELCDVLYHFLNGDTVIRENNWIEFIVPHPTMDASKLLDHLFYKNRNFKLLQTFAGEKIEAKMIPESIKLARNFIGNSKEFGGRYIKLKIAFAIRIRLLNPVPDLSDEEIYNHYVIPMNYGPVEFRRACWRAIKAITYDREGVYCSRMGCFIAKAPCNDAEYDKIFVREMAARHSAEIEQLLEFGSIAAFTPEGREILASGLKNDDFEENGHHEGSMFTSIADADAKGGLLIRIRTPRTDTRPHLFVQNVRKGVECCRSCMSSWQGQKRADSLSIKYGCFEIVVEKTRHRVGWQYFYSLRNQTTFNSNGSREVADQHILEFATAYLNDALAFLEAAADFVEKLLAGTKSVETLNANLSQRILDMVRISPVDFMDCHFGVIKDLANRCVLGDLYGS